jgi:lipid-A-disaccharide synthase-like uncharacterized protein
VEWVGYIGFVALSLSWIPQSIDTIKRGETDVNTVFLILASVGSGALMLYAIVRSEPVFVAVNALTTSGALLNLFYKLFPRRR